MAEKPKEEGFKEAMMKSSMEDRCYGKNPLSRRAGCPHEIDVLGKCTEKKEWPVIPKGKVDQEAVGAEAEAAAAAAPAAVCAESDSVGCGYMLRCQPQAAAAVVTTTTTMTAIAAIAPIVRPESCAVKEVVRRLEWDWHFSLKQMEVPGTLKASFSPEAKTLLAGADKPMFVIPKYVQLLSTSNTAPISFLAKADFIPVEPLILNSGLFGTFSVPFGQKSYSAKEGQLYQVDEDKMKELTGKACLFGASRKELEKSGVEKVSETTVRIRAGSELARLIAMWNPKINVSDPMLDQALATTVGKLESDIAETKKVVFSPDDMNVTLMAMIGVGKTDVDSVLKYALGDYTPKQRDYYEKKANHITVVMEVVCQVLVPPAPAPAAK